MNLTVSAWKARRSFGRPHAARKSERHGWANRVMTALVLLLGGAVAAPAVEVDAARKLVENTSAEILTLANGESTDQEKRVSFVALLQDRSDVNRIARYTVGREWRAMSDVQRVNYRDAIIPYIATRFVKSFNDFRGGSLEVKSAIKAVQGREERALVQSVGRRRTNNNPTDIEWVITDLEGRPVILDVKVENLSLVITQRKEIGTILNSVGGDFDKLIVKLKQATGESI